MQYFCLQDNQDNTIDDGDSQAGQLFENEVASQVSPRIENETLYHYM